MHRKVGGSPLLVFYLFINIFFASNLSLEEDILFLSFLYIYFNPLDLFSTFKLFLFTFSQCETCEDSVWPLYLGIVSSSTKINI